MTLPKWERGKGKGKWKKEKGKKEKDFRYKIAISSKEARETHFWLRLIHSKFLPENEHVIQAGKEAKECKAIFGKGLKTSRRY